MRILRSAVVLGISTPLLVLACGDGENGENGGSGGGGGSSGSKGKGGSSSGKGGSSSSNTGGMSMGGDGTGNAGATASGGVNGSGGVDSGGAGGMSGANGSGGQAGDGTGGVGASAGGAAGAAGMGASAGGAAGAAGATAAGTGGALGGAGGAGGAGPECGDGIAEPREICYDGAVPYGLGEGLPMDVAIGDWSGDGWPDVIVARGASGTSYLPNTGFGVMGSDTYLAGGGTAVGVGQLDLGSNLDILGSNPSDTAAEVMLLFGDGTGGLAVPIETANHGEGTPVNYFVGDIPGTPASQDVISVSPDCVAIWVTSGLQGEGYYDASFQDCAGSLGDAAFAELGFGSIDLVYSLTSAPTIVARYLSYTTGPSTLTPSGSATYTVGDNPSQLDVADFDENGSDDLAVALSAKGEIDVMFSDGGEAYFVVVGGGGETYLPLTIGDTAADYPFDVKAGDFDGDGHKDIAATLKGKDQIAVFLGDGQRGFDGPKFVDTGVSTGPTRLAVGELNDDGLDDFVVVAAATSKVLVILSNK